MTWTMFTHNKTPALSGTLFTKEGIKSGAQSKALFRKGGGGKADGGFENNSGKEEKYAYF